MGFEELGAAGRAAVSTGNHEVEAAPDEDGLRWGPSVILRPEATALERLDAWTSALRSVVGPAHWPTGAASTAHVTVRTLRGRQPTGLERSLIGRYGAALSKATEAVGPVRFQTGSVLLSPISVMLGLSPLDESAGRLATALAQALGHDGWFEKNRVRDIWYVNLIHFTGPIANTVGLLSWVDDFDQSSGFVLGCDAIEVVRWDFDGQRMFPTPLAHVSLA